MAAERPLKVEQVAIRNPFRRSQVAPALKYTIDLRHEHIDGSRYNTFQRLFIEHALEPEFISGELHTIHRSMVDDPPLTT
jgi:hypothetical protein